MAPVLCRVGYCAPLRTGPLRGGCGGETIRLSGGRARPELEGVLAFFTLCPARGLLSGRVPASLPLTTYMRARPFDPVLSPWGPSPRNTPRRHYAPLRAWPIGPGRRVLR